MHDSSPLLHRAQKKRHEQMQPGLVLSFTTVQHPPACFGKAPRTIGLVELTDGTRVLAPLLADHPFIGQNVHPRMRLSHVTDDKLRIYEVAYEALSPVAAPVRVRFQGYILALTGPSGVGKSTVSRLLIQMFGGAVANVPILTTRNPKEGDDGEYVYTTPKDFDRLRTKHAIVAETRIPSSTEERHYGYRSDDIEAIWNAGKVPVVITEMNLLQGLARHFGRRSILSFGLLPPGRSKRAKLSQLLHRLRTRGRETEEHIRDRLKNAERDLAFFKERKDLFDHFVVNEDLDAVIASMKKRVPGLSGM